MFTGFLISWYNQYMKKTLTIIVAILIIIAGVMLWNTKEKVTVNSYEECVAAGNPVLESYPEQCNTKDGKHFTRDVGNEVAKMDVIKITSPRPGAEISSPLTVTGEARGTWFFEASFPIMLTDWDGKIIAEAHAQAQGNWMTTEFVPFKATVNFTKPVNAPNNRGTLILKKDNPSGLPANDDALEIPIVFK
jgi:hypothetical protein